MPRVVQELSYMPTVFTEIGGHPRVSGNSGGKFGLGLIGVAFAMVVILGPFGLILLGLLTLFICTSVSLREDNPTWGPEVFKSRIGGDSSPEQRAAQAAEREQTLKPLRF